MEKRIAHYTYQLRDFLGKGSYSNVYKCVDDLTQETLAIKIIEKRLMQSQMNAELILGEIEVMKTLSHPNIVLMKDVYQTNNNFYLILEFCNQGDLEQYMKKNQLDETGALQVFYQIVQGYEYLYLQNFMHRDLKPANIFFSNNSVKIADFGFVKKYETNQPIKTKQAGSPIYTSPQILKGEYYTYKCDMFSLGMLLYEMLHGQNPYVIFLSQVSAMTKEEVISQMQQKNIQFNPNVSQQVRELILKLTSFEEQDRMSFEELKAHPLLQAQYFQVPETSQKPTHQKQDSFIRQDSYQKQDNPSIQRMDSYNQQESIQRMDSYNQQESIKRLDSYTQQEPVIRKDSYQKPEVPVVKQDYQDYQITTATMNLSNQKNQIYMNQKEQEKYPQQPQNTQILQNPLLDFIKLIFELKEKIKNLNQSVNNDILNYVLDKLIVSKEQETDDHQNKIIFQQAKQNLQIFYNNLENQPSLMNILAAEGEQFQDYGQKFVAFSSNQIQQSVRRLNHEISQRQSKETQFLVKVETIQLLLNLKSLLVSPKQIQKVSQDTYKFKDYSQFRTAVLREYK